MVRLGEKKGFLSFPSLLVNEIVVSLHPET
jgi:hypothetical protein